MAVTAAPPLPHRPEAATATHAGGQTARVASKGKRGISGVGLQSPPAAGPNLPGGAGAAAASGPAASQRQGTSAPVAAAPVGGTALQQSAAASPLPAAAAAAAATAAAAAASASPTVHWGRAEGYCGCAGDEEHPMYYTTTMVYVPGHSASGLPCVEGVRTVHPCPPDHPDSTHIPPSWAAFLCRAKKYGEVVVNLPVLNQECATYGVMLGAFGVQSNEAVASMRAVAFEMARALFGPHTAEDSGNTQRVADALSAVTGGSDAGATPCGVEQLRQIIGGATLSDGGGSEVEVLTILSLLCDVRLALTVVGGRNAPPHQLWMDPLIINDQAASVRGSSRISTLVSASTLYLAVYGGHWYLRITRDALKKHYDTSKSVVQLGSDPSQALERYTVLLQQTRSAGEPVQRAALLTQLGRPRSKLPGRKSSTGTQLWDKHRVFELLAHACHTVYRTPRAMRLLKDVASKLGITEEAAAPTLASAQAAAPLAAPRPPPASSASLAGAGAAAGGGAGAAHVAEIRLHGEGDVVEEIRGGQQPSASAAAPATSPAPPSAAAAAPAAAAAAAPSAAPAAAPSAAPAAAAAAAPAAAAAVSATATLAAATAGGTRPDGAAAAAAAPEGEPLTGGVASILPVIQEEEKEEEVEEDGQEQGSSASPVSGSDSSDGDGAGSDSDSSFTTVHTLVSGSAAAATAAAATALAHAAAAAAAAAGTAAVPGPAPATASAAAPLPLLPLPAVAVAVTAAAAAAAAVSPAAAAGAAAAAPAAAANPAAAAAAADAAASSTDAAAAAPRRVTRASSATLLQQQVRQPSSQ
jgi:hypothetical protein